MPNLIDANGLQVATQAELSANITTQLQTIFGVDINVNPDSPDAQMINIFIQVVLDLLNFIVQTNASFDPDEAIGTILDQRVTYNGIQRQAGTFTVTPIQIVTSQACTLYGLDQTAQPVYTVQDDNGNQWELQDTQFIAGDGTYNFNFQSSIPGAITTILNTISIPVTIVLGVVSINNPVTYTTLGENEETDPQLRLRRQKSVALSSQGYNNSLRAALLNINGVSSAIVHENVNDDTDANGIPGHAIWVIVSGSGAAASIGQAIYVKRNAGCNMKGSLSYAVTQADGSLFSVFWDEVTTEDLYIKFTALSLDGINAPNISLIVSQLPLVYTPGVHSQVNINELATLVHSIDPNTLVINAGFSLSAGGSYTNTLTPTDLNNQFGVASARVIVLTMILSASGALPVIVNGVVTETTVTTGSGGETIQFTGLGGYGTLTYSMVSGAGSINSSSGLYTSATAGTDVVQVEDDLGNTATSTITVT